MVGDSVATRASGSTGLWIRSCFAGVALMLVLAPTVAAESRGKCRAMSRQIAHFNDVGRMARSRGNRAWEVGTMKHIAKLEIRQRRLCPRYLASIEVSKTRKKLQQAKALMKKAALAAARYFAFGF